MKQRADRQDFEVTFDFLREHFGQRMDNNQVTWFEVQQQLQKFPDANPMFAAIVQTMVTKERQNVGNVPQSRVHNQAPRREEESGADRHAGFKRGVDSASERELRRHGAEILAATDESERNKKSLRKLVEELRETDKQIQLLQAKRTETEQCIQKLQQTMTFDENRLKILLDRKSSKAVDLTTDDHVMERIPVSSVQDLRQTLADAAEKRKQDESGRGKQPAVGRGQSSALGGTGIDSRVVTGNGSSKLAGIRNYCGDWADNICWLSSGVKFLIVGLDLDDPAQVRGVSDVELLKTVKRLLIRNVYPQTIRGNCPEMGILFQHILDWNKNLVVGKFNDSAEFVRIFLNKYTLPKLTQCSTGMSTFTKEVTSELRDLTCFAHLMLEDKPGSGPVSLADAFEATSNTASQPNNASDVIETFSQLVIEPDIRRLFVQVTRGYVGRADHTAKGLVSLRENIEIQNIRFRLLGFVSRPSVVHYTAVLRDGDNFFEHDDAQVTQVGKDLSKYEGNATFLVYERIQ